MFRRPMIVLMAAATLCATVAAPVAALSPPREPSVVANPGPMRVVVTGGEIAFGGFSLPLPECDATSDDCASFGIELGANGTFTVPPGALPLPGIDVPLDELLGGSGVALPGGLGVDLRVEAFTSQPMVGLISPATGTVRLGVGLGVRIVPELGNSGLPSFLLGGASGLGCSVGPIRLDLTSGSRGGVSGEAYDPATGRVSLVDGSFAVPALTCSPLLVTLLQAALGGAAGGAGELDLADLLAQANGFLGLPAAPGGGVVRLDLAVTGDGSGDPAEPGGISWPATSFRDVPASAPVEPAVRWLFAHGITQGKGGSASVFGSDGVVTRAQMATFLWRMMDQEPADGSCGFDDVDPSAFFANAVCWLRDAGVTEGTAPDEFSPGDPVTRGQMALFLWRLAGEQDVDDPAAFDDLDLRARYVAAVDWLKANGITLGVDPAGRRFAPGATVSRAQMALFLHRLASKSWAWSPEVGLPSTYTGPVVCLAIELCPSADPGVSPGDPGVPPSDGDDGEVSPEEPGRVPDVIGMTEAQAVATITDAGFAARVVERDNRPLQVTMDFRTDRVNLVVNRGIVTRSMIG